jgi:7,8-dihydroneopterin aldolase/epimerase/oxygenase
MNWGRVFVEGLQLEASIGILEHERRALQPLLVDIELEVDTGAPVEGDINSVFDYRAPVECARALVAAGHIELVETFAENLAKSCLDDDRVRSVRVRVSKPDAIKEARTSGVEIVRP